VALIKWLATCPFSCLNYANRATYSWCCNLAVGHATAGKAARQLQWMVNDIDNENANKNKNEYEYENDNNDDVGIIIIKLRMCWSFILQSTVTIDYRLQLVVCIFYNKWNVCQQCLTFAPRCHHMVPPYNHATVPLCHRCAAVCLLLPDNHILFKWNAATRRQTDRQRDRQTDSVYLSLCLSLSLRLSVCCSVSLYLCVANVI